uniref:Uncharacterized protein n=1 Tax=Rhipicephalus zambeziensis TaxID=60191 RepID=A0A224YGM2_9ACAR
MRLPSSLPSHVPALSSRHPCPRRPYSHCACAFPLSLLSYAPPLSSRHPCPRRPYSHCACASPLSLLSYAPPSRLATPTQAASASEFLG